MADATYLTEMLTPLPHHAPQSIIQGIHWHICSCAPGCSLSNINASLMVVFVLLTLLFSLSSCALHSLCPPSCSGESHRCYRVKGLNVSHILI